MGSLDAGLLLIGARAETGLSQRQLARLSGVSERTIRALETGAIGAPRRSTVSAIFAHLEISSAAEMALLGLWGCRLRRPVSLEQALGHSVTASTLVERHAVQPGSLRELLIAYHMTLDADRRRASERVSRAFEPLTTGVDRIVTGVGIDLTQMDPSRFHFDCMNCRIGRMALASTELLLVELLFDQTLFIGDTYTCGYLLDYHGAYRTNHQSAQPDNEAAWVIRSPGPALDLDIDFAATGPPAAIWQFGSDCPKRSVEAGRAVSISRHHRAQLWIAKPRAGVHGLTWRW